MICNCFVKLTKYFNTFISSKVSDWETKNFPEIICSSIYSVTIINNVVMSTRVSSVVRAFVALPED